MPNKTIYVSDDDLPLYQRAQDLVGGSLSAAISTALRRFVEAEEGRHEGYDEITVAVGHGARRKVRFSGVLLGEWGHSSASRVEVYRVYRSRSGKFVVHRERSPESTPESYSENASEGWRSYLGLPEKGGWRSYLGLGESSWSFVQGDSTLEVFDSFDALRDKIPDELYDIVSEVAEQPAIEDLDI